MPKYKVNESFRDKDTKEPRMKGTEVELTKKRFDEITKTLGKKMLTEIKEKNK